LIARTAGAATGGLLKFDVTGLLGFSARVVLPGPATAAGKVDADGWVCTDPVVVGAVFPVAGGAAFSGKLALGNVGTTGTAGIAIKSINSGS